MNLFKKVYCRIYQTAFHLAYPFLPYREPEILNSTLMISREIHAMGINSAMIVTDSFLHNSGAIDALKASLDENKIRYTVYDRTRPNPTAENVEQAFEIYSSQAFECLIGFGGGSAIDCAKAIGARAAYPKRSLDKLKGNLKILRRLPPIFAVPTTAGTGSEVTVTAVITDTVKKHKYTMNAFPLIPAFAVHDPENTYTLPPHLTATTGMDAFTHAVEAYIGRSTTRETRQLCKQAIKLIYENILTAYSSPQDRNARENMLAAAYMAGNAFSKSYVGYIHAVAHSLGGEYNIPHGLANSVLLPIVLEEYGSCIHEKLHALALFAGICDEHDTVICGAKKFISEIRRLNQRMGIPEKLSGICEKTSPAWQSMLTVRQILYIPCPCC